MLHADVTLLSRQTCLILWHIYYNIRKSWRPKFHGGSSVYSHLKGILLEQDPHAKGLLFVMPFPANKIELVGHFKNNESKV